MHADDRTGQSDANDGDDEHRRQRVDADDPPATRHRRGDRCGGGDTGPEYLLGRKCTGATANKGFDIDEVKGRIAAPASAMTAIGADIETGRATP